MITFIVMIINFFRAATAAGILLCTWIIPVNGQQSSFAEQVHKAYGPNQKLVNGVQYYNRYVLVQDHPYFLDDSFVDGSVIINGQEYSPVRIRYNIYSQHLELQYDNFAGASNSLITVNDHIDGFRYGDLWFRKMDLDGEENFYQVIATEQFSCFVLWGKKLDKIDYSLFYGERFTEPSCGYQLLWKGDTLDFKSMNTFVKCFHESRRKEIKRFLRQNRFDFKRPAPIEIVRNMHEVSNLLNAELTP